MMDLKQSLYSKVLRFQLLNLTEERLVQVSTEPFESLHQKLSSGNGTKVCRLSPLKCVLCSVNVPEVGIYLLVPIIFIYSSIASQNFQARTWLCFLSRFSVRVWKCVMELLVIICMFEMTLSWNTQVFYTANMFSFYFFNLQVHWLRIYIVVMRSPSLSVAAK